MSERVQNVVRRGKWLYDENVPYDAWIIKQNYCDDRGALEAERAIGPSKRDNEGYFFYAAYGRQHALLRTLRMATVVVS